MGEPVIPEPRGLRATLAVPPELQTWLTRWLSRLAYVYVFGLSLVTGCGVGQSTVCEDDVCPCSEGGIRDAVTKGGGPYRFACDGPVTVVTESEIVFDKRVSLDGEGNLTVDGDAAHRVFRVAMAVGIVELRGITVTAGKAELQRGGGIANEGALELIDSTIKGNQSRQAGGIFNAGLLTMTNSEVSENAAEIGGGGVLNVGTLLLIESAISGNTAVFGGGISNAQFATLTNSEVSGNSAELEGGGISNTGKLTLTDSTVSGNTGAFGGGIVTSGDSTTLANSTVSGNTGRDGGGIANYSGGTLMLSNSTVSGNSADNSGGGIFNDDMMVLANSTVAENTSDVGRALSGTPDDRSQIWSSLIEGDCAFEEGAPGFEGQYNIESPGDTCGLVAAGNDLVEISAEQLNLGPLEDNGGPTMTHALLTEPTASVAIDRIPLEDCVDGNALVVSDQRGFPRPVGDGCDVGAFELQP